MKHNSPLTLFLLVTTLCSMHTKTSEAELSLAFKVIPEDSSSTHLLAICAAGVIIGAPLTIFAGIALKNEKTLCEMVGADERTQKALKKEDVTLEDKQDLINNLPSKEAAFYYFCEHKKAALGIGIGFLGCAASCASYYAL